MPENATAVKYIGVATVRRITEEDWASINVKGQSTVVWDARNGYTVSAKDLKADAIKYLREDAGFAVLSGEGNEEK